jgi:NAD(P)-dependent dehydrogenase (short-subunit alcohol dehydrogenase family)
VILAPGMVAVVTGAASGIGRAMADAFAARGFKVVMVDVESRALDNAVQEVGSTGAAVLGVRADVRDAVQVADVAARTRAAFGPADVVCANAGVITARLPVWQQPATDWAWTVEVNVLGAANAVRAFVPDMIERGRGHVVFTASIAGLAPLPGGGNGAYSASKHAIVGLAETLRTELDEHAPDVGVTLLCPGPVPTRFHDAARNRPADKPEANLGGPAQTPRFSHGMATVSAPDIARAVITAIEENRLYLLPAAGTATYARRRIERLLADLPPD